MPLTFPSTCKKKTLNFHVLSFHLPNFSYETLANRVTSKRFKFHQNLLLASNFIAQLGLTLARLPLTENL